MTMLRKEALGVCQIGVYAVVREKPVRPRWIATACSGVWNYRQEFASLADAYLELTGEPLRQGRSRK